MVMVATLDLSSIPLIRARHYTPANRTAIDLVVLHSMESPEKGDTAENVARWFAGATAPQASAHYCVDADSIVRCVPDDDVAWHAPGANARGLGIELAGMAAQREAEWRDPYSTAELNLAARLVGALCSRWDIPTRFVAATDLLQGERGITTHAEVSRAWKKSTHWDPGPGFPMQWFLTLVRDADPNPPDPEVVVPNSNAPFATILVHPAGGYLEIGTDGGIFAWGGAPFYGSLGGTQLNAPIVDAAWTPDHGGYYLIGRDGGIFAFGNAKHAGNALYSGD